MKEALIDKDEVIIAHRKLIKKLYFQVQGYENNMKIMRQIIKTLKKQLLANNMPLPDISQNSKLINLETQDSSFHSTNFPSQIGTHTNTTLLVSPLSL